MNEDNNDIEKFFSHRLNEGNIPFEASDWNAMEEKLDQFDAMAPVQSNPASRLITLAVFSVLFFLGGWYGHQWLVDGRQGFPVSEEMTSVPGIATEDTSGQTAAGETVDPGDADTTTRMKPANPFVQNSSGAVVSQAHLTNIADDQKRGRTVVNNPEAVNAAPGLGRVAGKTPGHWMVRLPAPAVLHPEEVYEPGYSSSERRKDAEAASPWSIGLVTAPDLNGVGAFQNYKIAWEVGGQVYYQLSDRWRLSSGVLYAKKAYTANGEDYSPPEGYWQHTTNGVIPEEVDAQCGIIDIPVNITYTWNPQSRFRFITSAGLSSYIILNEDYQYTFGNYGYGTGYNQWSTDENSASWMGMFNLSTGMEWGLRRGWVFGVEPYVKIPLKEIGFGQVQLTGAGMFLSLRKQLN